MAINLAQKYMSKTSDLLKARRKSEPFVNNDWDWDGVNAINVYTLNDPIMGNYNPNGANRYGDVTEVEDTIQTWTLTRDRSWTKSIDKKNFQDQMMIKRPAKYLAQATKNVLVPEMDTYIFQVIATAGSVAARDNIVADAATTASNAWTNFTAIHADILDKEGTEEGLQAAMTAQYYNFLKQGGFVLASDKGQTTRNSGNLGTVDGIPITIVPSTRMPATSGAIDLLISHPNVTVAPEKLEDYTLHQNPPGISGNLLEYRHRYDAFVDINKTQNIGMHAVA